VHSKRDRIRERRLRKDQSRADTESAGGASKTTRSLTMRGGGKKASAEI